MLQLQPVFPGCFGVQPDSTFGSSWTADGPTPVVHDGLDFDLTTREGLHRWVLRYYALRALQRHSSGQEHL